MSVTFISCVYYDLYETEFNGRTSRELHYLYSLRNILNTDTNLCLYTSEEHIPKVTKFLEPSHNKNIKIIPLDLRSTKLYERLKPVKSTNLLEPMRCYEIMYSKTDWLNEVVTNNPFNSNYFYWIDAGLSHHGLFPQRFRRNNTGDPQYDQWYNYNLFNSSLVEHVLRPDLNKLFAICLEQHTLIQNRYITELFETPRQLPLHFIGGLFGGSPASIKWFYDTFNKRLNKALEIGLLPTEEQIYTSILHDNLSKFDYRTFNTWYYPDPKNPIFDNFMPYLQGHTPKPFFEIFL